MSNRFVNQLKPLAVLALALANAFFFSDSILAAETYAVPQTTEVTLAWDSNDPIPDGYRIYQRMGDEPYDYAQPVWTGSTTNCTIYNLAYNTTYNFIVRAYSTEMESADSNEVSFVAPSAPSMQYTIASTASGGGSISPMGTVTVDEGVGQTFTLSTDAGYYIADVLVDGVSIGAVSSYAFPSIAENHTIHAEFDPYSHSISATADANGSISPSGEIVVNQDASQGFTIVPRLGYRVADLFIDGVSVGALTTYRFDQVSGDHTIHATFKAETYTITALGSDNGSITPHGSTTIVFGGSQTYTLIPNSGYSITDVIVDGVSIGETGSYTFANVKTDHTISALFALDNQPPTADSGPDQTVDEASMVILNGLNSFDPDDGIATFQWRQIKGAEVVLSSPLSPETTFIAPNVSASGMALVFELSAADYSGAVSVDTCIVNVTWVNQAPSADAGEDQTVQERTDVPIDASNSTDADDGIVSYTWRQLNGPVVSLSDPASATATFQAPEVGSEGASMTFEVTVTDAGGLQDTDTCLVNVTWVNSPPVANAGEDQQVSAGDEVILDGSQSWDADDHAAVSYRWHQSGGIPVELSDATAQSPVFVAPDVDNPDGLLTFELTVADSAGLMATDTCLVSVTPKEPALDAVAPIASIINPIKNPLTVWSRSINLSGSAWDDREVAKVVWKNSAGGGGVAVGTTNWSIGRITLKRGKNVITVTAYDTSGNQGSASKTVYRAR